MRILHVISGIDPENGGPSMALRGLSEAQVRAGLDVTVLATWQRPEAPRVADEWRARGVHMGLIGPARGKLSRHPDLVTTVRREVAQADVVHIHGLWEEIQHQAARACQRQSRPYIMRPCGLLEPWSLAQNRLIKSLYLRWRLRKNLDHAAAIHATSQAERESIGLLGLASPVIVEPNGVTLEEFVTLPAAGEFRARYPAIADRPLLVMLGRIHHKKGLDLLVPALARLRTDAILALVGPDDGYGVQVRRLAEKHGVADRVILTGMLHGRDRVAALRDADLFVLPSYSENFGIAVVEALAAGTPVIVSDQVALHGEVTAGGVGGVVPLDVDRLAAEIERWLGDKALCEAARARARALVWQKFDWNQIARRWKSHYMRLMTEGARSSVVAEG